MLKRSLLLLVIGAALGAAAAVALVAHADPPAAVAVPAPPEPPKPAVAAAGLLLDSAQIATGRLTMERMPVELGQALDTQSDEIVKNAEAIESKQARITGTCAPGSAIRLIAEDGTVRCQRLPKGIVSVAAVAGVPLNATTGTAVGNVPGGVGRYQTAGEDDLLAVPVVLPDGAVITSLTLIAFDNSDASDGAAYLYRSDAATIAQVETSGAASEVRSFTTDHIDRNHVDAGRYAYVVLFRLSAQAGAALLPISASIGYRLP